MPASVRKVMGRGSYTMSGRGMTSYCMSDGRTHCTSEDYKAVETNFIATWGDSQHVDKYGARYWYVKGLGVIILPMDNGSPFKYVEVDKHCTPERFAQLSSE